MLSSVVSEDLLFMHCVYVFVGRRVDQIWTSLTLLEPKLRSVLTHLCTKGPKLRSIKNVKIWQLTSISTLKFQPQFASRITMHWMRRNVQSFIPKQFSKYLNSLSMPPKGLLRKRDGWRTHLRLLAHFLAPTWAHEVTLSLLVFVNFSTVWGCLSFKKTKYVYHKHKLFNVEKLRQWVLWPWQMVNLFT